MRLGVMGGTFDPPHLGHLIVAGEAHALLDLDVVLFVPAGDPWHKPRVHTPAHHRLTMTELAVAGDSRFAVSAIDVDRAGPTYTVDTLTDLRTNAGQQDEFVLLVGSDALQGIGSWHRADELPGLARIVVTPPAPPAPGNRR
jgi:nicotinate-nucleotide adenylyltransferase